MLLSALLLGQGMAWRSHHQLHSADGLKTNTLWGLEDLGEVVLGWLFVFCSKVPLKFSVNLFLRLSWIYKTLQISSNKTLLLTLCLFFLYFRGPVWMVISHMISCLITSMEIDLKWSNLLLCPAHARVPWEILPTG